MEFFADTSSRESVIHEWRAYLDENGYWVSPDHRVKTDVAAVLLGRSVSTLRTWRGRGFGPDYLSGPIVTYRLEELADFYLDEIA